VLQEFERVPRRKLNTLRDTREQDDFGESVEEDVQGPNLFLAESHRRTYWRVCPGGGRKLFLRREVSERAVCVRCGPPAVRQAGAHGRPVLQLPWMGPNSTGLDPADAECSGDLDDPERRISHPGRAACPGGCAHSPGSRPPQKTRVISSVATQLETVRWEDGGENASTIDRKVRPL